MKQYISVEQLQELTEEQKNKLRDMWEPRPGDYVYYDDGIEILNELWIHKDFLTGYKETDTYKSSVPVLSIGQMIEMLQPQRIDRDSLNRYTVIFNNNRYTGNELVDALWSAVKSIL